MILAELEVFHSRAAVPTRRVAVGRCSLPLEAPLRAGGLLVAGVVGRYHDGLDDDSHDDLALLMAQIDGGQRIRQPRLRHRLQEDRIGLTRSRHRLVRDPDGRPAFRFSERGGAPAQYVLGALYAVQRLPAADRRDVLALAQRALAWPGGADSQLMRFLDGFGAGKPLIPEASQSQPRAWALSVLGLESNEGLATDDIQRSFRRLVATVHPDSGGASLDAGERISELVEARRILLS